MQLAQKIRIEAEPKEVFALVGDPTRYPQFLAGMTTWKQLSAGPPGVGSQFRTLMKVGSVEVGGVVEVDRWDESEFISWHSETGVRQTGAWRLEPVEGGTELRLEIGYDVGGGPIGWLTERLAARTMARNMWATLLACRRLVEESEPPHADGG